ncbi:hypothetical protein LTR53_002828 [Teratosphaeriaceae sp. CCFEE 6253]|nr:hypothetical protein LTR53_002828 [Teratosphaeriaceae sp. CCFEE 6253]
MPLPLLPEVRAIPRPPVAVIAPPATVDAPAWPPAAIDRRRPAALARVRILQDDVPSVQDSRDPAEEEQEDVDEEGASAARADHDGERGEEDGDEAESETALVTGQLDCFQ